MFRDSKLLSILRRPNTHTHLHSEGFSQEVRKFPPFLFICLPHAPQSCAVLHLQGQIHPPSPTPKTPLPTHKASTLHDPPQRPANSQAWLIVMVGAELALLGSQCPCETFCKLRATLILPWIVSGPCLNIVPDDKRR